MSLQNTGKTESAESETEYDESDLSSDEECSYTQTDDPHENGKEEQEIPPTEEGYNTEYEGIL